MMRFLWAAAFVAVFAAAVIGVQTFNERQQSQEVDAALGWSWNAPSSKVTCYSGGETWPGRRDGSCHMADRP